MRRGELLGLTWRFPARPSSSSSFPRAAASASDHRSRAAHGARWVDEETVAALASHRDAQLAERDFAGEAYVDRDLVFADPLGGPIHPQRLSEWFVRHRKAAGVPSGTLHVLRHTAATLALTNGVPVHIVAVRLGDDPKTVLATYAHLLPQSDELAAEAVAALVRQTEAIAR